MHPGSMAVMRASRARSGRVSRSWFPMRSMSGRPCREAAHLRVPAQVCAHPLLPATKKFLQ
jgi:hypothetical protein